MPTDPSSQLPISANSWPLAPSWAILTGEIGKIIIFIALLAFLTSFLASFFAGKYSKYINVSQKAFWIGTVSVFLAIFCLGALFANDQFEFNYVFGHGDAGTQFRYKIAGIWSGQEGSFLLWACTASLFCSLAGIRSGIYKRWFYGCTAFFLSTLAGIIAYETPFTLGLINGKALLPPMGAGLTPSLQNYWVVIHPPTIFSGFGSLTVAAAFGLSAMLTGNVVDHIKIMRPWVLLSTAILGLGLCFGGFWAYETLGWGGFWMWDPVENVSFVPWVLSIALLHGIIIQSAKKQWTGVNLVLAGLPFFLFCYGTFLTRSGFLADASVHSFAQMNHTALFILAGFVIFSTLFYFIYYATKGRALATVAEEPLQLETAEATTTRTISRQKMYTSGVVVLCGLAATTAIGMSIPFFLALMNRPSKVVEVGLYHQVVSWFFIPMMILMAIAPFVTWREMSGIDLWKRFSNVLAITIGSLGFVLLACRMWAWHGATNLTIPFPFHIYVYLIPWMMVLIGLCSFVTIANGWRLIETFRKSPMSVGGFVSHIGIAVLMSGLIISLGFQEKERAFVQEGTPVAGLDYMITYKGMTHPEENGLLNSDNKAQFEMVGSRDTFIASPGLYYIRDNHNKLSAMIWPYQEHRPFYDVYFELYAPVLDAWKDPITFAPGETKVVSFDSTQSNLSVNTITTFNGLRMVGKPGGIGTKFVADLTFKIATTDNKISVYHASPSIEITKDGPKANMDSVGKDFVVDISSMDAATKSVSAQLHFTSPIYPIELYYKPMVILVWMGAVITFAGGLLSAYYRRVPTPKKVKPQKSSKNYFLDENLDPSLAEESEKPQEVR